MNNGRPEPCANIYKHGRLKNKEEMALERERLKNLSFNELLAESKPMGAPTMDHLEELTKGADINLDAALPTEGQE